MGQVGRGVAAAIPSGASPAPAPAGLPRPSREPITEAPRTTLPHATWSVAPANRAVGRKSPSSRRPSDASLPPLSVAPAARARHGRPAVPAADGPSDLQCLSQVGGSLIDIAATNAVDDKRLFVAMGARIEVYDVLDAGSPRRLGESAPLPWMVMVDVMSGFATNPEMLN